MNWRSLSLILLLLACALTCQAQQTPLWELHGLTPESEFDSVGSNDFVFSHGAIVSNQTSIISMDHGTADDLTGEVVAEGDVTILDRGHIWRGTNFIYNFKTGAVRADTFKTVQEPFIVSGSSLVGVSNSIYTATNAVITTDDYAIAGYHIRAQKIIIVLGKSFEAHHAWLYWRNVPIFYFPYYKRTLGQHPNNFQYQPGYRSLFGPYLLSAYNWYGNGLLDGTVHLDVRETRGVAAGPDLLFHLGDYGEGAFRYYYAYDQQPNADDLNEPHLDKDRQRLAFNYQVEPKTNLMIKAIANYQSDPLVLHDFFENEYRTNVEPSSFVEAQQLWPNYTLNALIQPRLVTFFETVERLPDIKLSGARQQVGETPLFYENESSVGYFRREFSNTNMPSYFTNEMLEPDGLGYFPVHGYAPNPSDYGAARADTFHQLTLPETFFDWLNVTPRVGGRLTYYGQVDGPAIHTNAQVRGVFNTGMEVSFKASKIYREAESDFFDIHELRHIIEPDIDYVYVPAPSRSPSQLPQFDYLSPSLRLMPIDFPDFNSIDSINNMNVLRLSLINKLQTKRAEGIEDVVNLAVYSDLNLNPTNHPFSDLYSDLDFRPRSWVTLNSSVRYDMADERWREAIERIVIQPSTAWSAAFSYRYIENNDPDFQDYPGETVPGHNLFATSLYYRLSENWGARVVEQFEAQDGMMQEQVYSIYRDLRSWTAALTFRVIQGEGVPADYTVAVTFSLKAFPRFGLNSDNDRPGQLLDSPSSVPPIDR